MNRKTAIADWFCVLPDGTPEFRPTDNKFWKDYNERANKNIKMFYGLYKSGELESLSEYFSTKDDKKEPDIKYVYFVIDVEKISDEFVKRMNKRYPGNSLNDIPKMGVCDYTQCIGLIDQPYTSYRDNCGCVSRSFELPSAMYISNAECHKLSKIAREQGPVQSGIELFK